LGSNTILATERDLTVFRKPFSPITVQKEKWINNSMLKGWRDRCAVRTVALAPLLALAGCTATELVQSWTPPAAMELAEPDYRRIVADNVKTLFPQASLGDLEISAVRMVDHLKGQAWLTCLKLDAHGTPQYYAIFIQAEKVNDSRAGVIADQRYKQVYIPFEATREATVSAASGPASQRNAPISAIRR
jgi:hypothetical protein